MTTSSLPREESLLHSPFLSAPPHVIPIGRILSECAVDVEQGLSSTEYQKRRQRYGPNELAGAPVTPGWRRLLAQFEETVIWILIVAAIIAGLMGEWVESAAILAIVLVNGIIGFLQEQKAERALSELQKLSSPTAKVIRNGLPQTIPARELIPGDIIQLDAGDNIPADARLLKAFGMSVQESALTGESESVGKDANCQLDEGVPLSDRCNMAYMGTAMAAGRAIAVVVATGMNTELGQIAALLERCVPEPTPLQRRLSELGKVLVFVCLLIVTVIFALQRLRGGKLLETLLISVSLAVAAVPEGLPAVVTLTLALGLQRMVRRNALVRKLSSVETLGSVTVICSDKTGTLTRNEMTVREIVIGNDRFEVTGGGYFPKGIFIKYFDQSNSSGAAVNPEEESDLTQLLTVAARCNNAIVCPCKGHADAWQVIGDPTEGALIVAALKAGIESHDQQHHLLYEIPFDSERKMMSVVMGGPDDARIMYSKGAPEVVLAKCVAEQRGGQVEMLSAERRAQIMQSNSELAGRAYRVLGLAYREYSTMQEAKYDEGDLVFAGLVGMIDPPRQEAKEAVSRCRRAGIRPVMITGDHPETALAIARELKIAGVDDRVVTGQELDALTNQDLASQVEQIAVYARVSAEHKLRVVNAWQQRNQIVAMTGDGVNDAPAVKAADIGIAMGVSGTDVTKEASDMVLTDDNFASIVNAVEEGRGIFDNIQKFVHYLLACNAGEVLLMFFAALVGWPVPLAAVQILWINLVTDGLPALALGLEPPESDLMSRPPRPPHEAVITLKHGFLILLHGILIATVAALGFWIMYQGDEANVDHARTVTFCIAAFAQLLFAVSCRSQRFTIPEFGPFSNPQLFGAIIISGLLQVMAVSVPFAGPVFEVPARLAWEWLLVGGLSLAPVVVIESTKFVGTKLRRSIPDRRSSAEPFASSEVTL